MRNKRLLKKVLGLAIFSISLGCLAQENCREIEASLKINQADLQGKSSVEVAVSGSKNNLILSLIGPKGYYKTDLQDLTIKDLNKGSYVLVITGRKESEKRCIKKIEFAIQ